MKPLLRFNPLLIAIITLVGVILMSFSPIAAQPKSLDSQLQPVVAQWMKDHPGLPGAIIGVWVKGYQPWKATFGVGNLEKQIPMQLTDHLRIGSNTKTFTGTVILQLAGEGKLSLDDKVAQYIPDITKLLNGKGGEITIRQLGNHSSGIVDYSKTQAFQDAYGNDPSISWTPEELLPLALQSKPLFDPGQSWSYSNTNSLLLGLIAEKITGNSIAAEIQNRILNPLGMTQTSFPTTPTIPEPYAHGYFYTSPSDTNPVDVSDWNPSWAWAAGQMISTLDDLYRYAKPLATGQLLTPEMQVERLKWNPNSEKILSEEADAFLPPGSKVVYKYGFQIMDMDGGIGHAGNVPGYNTFLTYIPELDATVIILTNTNQAPDSQKQKLFSPVYAIAKIIYEQLNQLPRAQS